MHINQPPMFPSILSPPPLSPLQRSSAPVSASLLSSSKTIITGLTRHCHSSTLAWMRVLTAYLRIWRHECVCASWGLWSLYMGVVEHTRPSSCSLPPVGVWAKDAACLTGVESMLARINEAHKLTYIYKHSLFGWLLFRAVFRVALCVIL